MEKSPKNRGSNSTDKSGAAAINVSLSSPLSSPSSSSSSLSIPAPTTSPMTTTNEEAAATKSVTQTTSSIELLKDDNLEGSSSLPSSPSSPPPPPSSRTTADVHPPPPLLPNQSHSRTTNNGSRRSKINRRVQSSTHSQELLRARAPPAATVTSCRRRNSNNTNTNTNANTATTEDSGDDHQHGTPMSQQQRQHHQHYHHQQQQQPRPLPSSSAAGDPLVSNSSSHASTMPLTSSTAGAISNPNTTRQYNRLHNQQQHQLQLQRRLLDQHPQLQQRNQQLLQQSRQQQPNQHQQPRQQQQQQSNRNAVFHPHHLNAPLIVGRNNPPPPPVVPTDRRRPRRQEEDGLPLQPPPPQQQQQNNDDPNHTNNDQPKPPPKGEWKNIKINASSSNTSPITTTPISTIATSDDNTNTNTTNSNQNSSTTTTTAPGPRSLHAAATWNRKILIFGGYDGESRRNDFYSFDLEEGKWSLLLGRGVEREGGGEINGRLPVVTTVTATVMDPPPSPRDRHAAFVHGNCFYVFGGFDGTSRVNDFHCYDLTTHTWRQILPTTSSQLPTPRHSHSAIVHLNSAYVFGGYDGSYRSDLYRYNFTTRHWSLLPSVGRSPRARYRATCVTWKDRMVLFGGHDGTRHLDDVHLFEFDTGIWTNVVVGGGGPSVGPSARDSHVSVVYGDAMYVFGGSAGSALNDLYELTLADGGGGEEEAGGDGGNGGVGGFVPAWRQVTCGVGSPPQHRFCHVGVMHDDSLYVFGGYDGSNRLDDFVRFEFSVDALVYEIPPSTLVLDLRSYLNNETLCDVTFIVEEHNVNAHKIMLMRCSYFKAMLTGNMMEAHQSAIHIEEVSHPIFLAVLEYLYTDELNTKNPAIENGYSAVNSPSMMDLFAAADLFGIPRLQAMCEKNILESMHAENASLIFHAADLYCAKSMRTKAMRYILENFESVSKTATFEEMARSNVELVFEILRMR